MHVKLANSLLQTHRRRHPWFNVLGTSSVTSSILAKAVGEHLMDRAHDRHQTFVLNPLRFGEHNNNPAYNRSHATIHICH